MRTGSSDEKSRPSLFPRKVKNFIRDTAATRKKKNKAVEGASKLKAAREYVEDFCKGYLDQI